MALSKKKREAIEHAKRVKVLQARALRPVGPHGYWMDAHDEATAAEYLRTGDATLLNDLPDYRALRS